ncbi:MAG: T9SS type A sorting domain-containing protein [Prevotella sp.]|nr:T9SS type A sorting domain-containing protein [Prevotella sp.]
MKRILFLLYICCCCLSISAADTHTILRVELKDGTSNDYVLADRPRISFEGDKVVFLCKSISTSYTRENIQNFVFLEDSNTGFQELKAGDTRISYSIEAGKVTIEGITENENLNIYSISGQQCQPSVNYSSNRAEILLTPLPNGYYIINIGNKQSIKIIKK